MSVMKKAASVVSGSILIALGILPAAIAAAAAPSISYSASATTPFSMLNVSGSGFSPQEQIALTLGLSTAHVTSDGGGNFSGAQLAVPSVPAGLYYIIAVGQSSGLVAFTSVYVNAFFPSASPSSWYIAPGSLLTWTGSGFAPGETMTVIDSHSTTVASFAANGSGSFAGAGSSAIPLSARNSTVTYTIHGSISGTNLSFPITVSDLYPSVTPSTWYAVPGTPVSFTGSGFGPNEGIDASLLGASTTAVAHITADASGSFTMSPLTLPFGMPSAQYRFTGSLSGASALVTVALASFYPSLSPSAYYVAPGSILAVGGSGFAPNESVTLRVNSVFAATTTASVSGDVAPISVKMPSAPNSTASIEARGALSGALVTIGVTVGQYYPNVTPSTWYTYPGNQLTFSGSGFGPNETVVMSGAMTGTTTADSSGNFAPFLSTVPLSASGVATVTFAGTQSGASETIGIALGVRNAAIWFDNYYAQGGSPLTVFGAGFGTSESVSLTAKGAVFATSSSDASGNLQAHTNIPFSLAGPLTITATGQDTGVTAHAELTVAPVYIDFQLGSYAVAVGSAVNFLGHGYLPHDPITITSDRTGSAVIASFTADASGNFNDASFVVPADWASGPLTVTAHGAHSMSSSSITLWVSGK